MGYPRIQWTNEMDDTLRENYFQRSALDIARELGLTKSSVLRRARILRLPKKQGSSTTLSPHWTPKEVETLKSNAHLSSEKLAVLLNKTKNSVLKKAMRINVPIGRDSSWSYKDVKFLKDNYLTMTYKEIGRHLNRTEEAVRFKARKNKLKKRF